MHESTVFPTEGLDTSPGKPRLKRVLLCLVDGGPERQAIEAGEIDAVIDYADRKVILFPAAERALRSTSKPTSTREPHANRILAALPSPEYRRLQHALEPVMLTEKQVLCEPGEPIRYVYFPLDSVISLLATAGSRRVLEVGLVGFEGMVGIPITLGVDVPSVRAMVNVPGAAMRVPEAQFREAYEKSRTLRHELTSYVYAELAMARQIAACSAFHTIEQRLARRLLMTADRVQSDLFSLTQKFVACALGVRRESISEAAGRLQKRGLIAYYRGNMQILNSRGLQSASCGCCTRIKRSNDHIRSDQRSMGGDG